MNPKLTSEQRDAIREVLLRLVQPGDGSADSRRRVPLRDLVPAGSTVGVVQSLITPLVNARLLTTGREADTGQDPQGLLPGCGSEHRDAPGAGGTQADGQLQEGRFAGAIGTH